MEQKRETRNKLTQTCPANLWQHFKSKFNKVSESIFDIWLLTAFIFHLTPSTFALPLGKLIRNPRPSLPWHFQERSNYENPCPHMGIITLASLPNQNKIKRHLLLLSFNPVQTGLGYLTCSPPKKKKSHYMNNSLFSYLPTVCGIISPHIWNNFGWGIEPTVYRVATKQLFCEQDCLAYHSVFIKNGKT